MAVSRTRIPTGMYPTGYTPSTSDGKVTPEAMTKDGSGEPINEEMMPDYDCGDEPGHYFISSPLNVYSIGRSGAVVLYVEGGCPNFTWESDNAWATFGTATTSVRYNTISSSATEGQDTVVTVTDTNGLEVTINVPWNGAASCCEDPPALSIQTPLVEIVGEFATCEVVVFIDGGCPPFTWATTTVTGTATLDHAATNSRRNRITGTAECWTLTVTDLCEQTATIGVYPMSVIDSHEFDETYCSLPRALRLSTGYYVVVYEGPDDDGWIKTFSIPASTGVVADVDNYEYTTANGSRSLITHITGNIYAVTSESQYIYTIEISSTGVITKSIKDSELINNRSGLWSILVHIADDVYALVWRSSVLAQMVSTYTIEASGAITAVDTLTAGVSGIPSHAALVTSNVVFSVALTDWGTFEVTTYGVSDAGVITDPYLDNHTFTIPGDDHGVNHGKTSVVEVASNIFAMTHQDIDVGATIATFQINDNGTIEEALIDSLLLANSLADSFPGLVYSGAGDVYYVAYEDTDDKGNISSIKITSAGAISLYDPCGDLEFDAGGTHSPIMLTPSDDWFPVFYKGPGDDGWVKTIDEG